MENKNRRVLFSHVTHFSRLDFGPGLGGADYIVPRRRSSYVSSPAEQGWGRGRKKKEGSGNGPWGWGWGARVALKKSEMFACRTCVGQGEARASGKRLQRC